MNAPSWTPEKLALLTKLWREGKSAAFIARQLETHSRNAVIGKVAYLRSQGEKLEMRDSHINRSWEHRTKPQIRSSKPIQPKAAAKTSQTQTPASDAPKPCGEPGQFPDNGCQWIEGPYSPEFVMCGAPLVRGKWCSHHAKIVYAPAHPGRRTA